MTSASVGTHPAESPSQVSKKGRIAPGYCVSFDGFIPAEADQKIGTVTSPIT
jgi:hypothetical protein